MMLPTAAMPAYAEPDAESAAETEPAQDADADSGSQENPDWVDRSEKDVFATKNLVI